jgi:hypothetical protein
LLIKLLLDLFNVRVEGFVRELVLFDHFREAINVAASMEHNEALFKSFKLISHEVDKDLENNFFTFSYLLGSFRVPANFR